MGRLFKRAMAVFSRAQIRAGSKRLGSKASSKPSDIAPGSVGDPGLVSSTFVGEGLSVVLLVALYSPSLIDGGSALGSTMVSSAPGLDLVVSAVPACSDRFVGRTIPVASASVRPFAVGCVFDLVVDSPSAELAVSKVAV